MKAEELIKEYKKENMIWNRNKFAPRNSMGCSEYWYYPEYCVYNAFSEEQLMGMSEKEIENLLHLAEVVGEALY